MYEQLDPTIGGYVDALVEHAQTALWPERRAALESFRRGIDKSDPRDLAACVDALGLKISPEADPAEVVFRAVLTAYLDRLAETEITNPDQAYVYSQSLKDAHAKPAASWLAAHPEYNLEDD